MKFNLYFAFLLMLVSPISKSETLYDFLGEVEAQVVMADDSPDSSEMYLDLQMPKPFNEVVYALVTEEEWLKNHDNWDSLLDQKVATLVYTRERGVQLHEGSTGKMTKINFFYEVHPLDYAQERCNDFHGYTTSAMELCAHYAHDAWDGELNRVYKLLGGSGNALLKNAQLKWIEYRDAQFEFIDDSHRRIEGSMYIPIMVDKKTEVIRDQVKKLYWHYTTENLN